MDISNNPNLIERYKNGVSKTEWMGSYDVETDVETIWYDLTEDSSTHFWVDAATEIHIHSWDGGKVTTEATEDSTGVMTYTCTGCGTVKTEIIPKLPKKEEQQPVPIDPTPVNPQPAPIVTPTVPVAPTEIVDLPTVKISKPKAAKKKITVKWKKVSKKNLKKISGIQIQVATDPSFTNIVKTATAGKKKTSKVIKGLQSKTKYYVRIRAYGADNHVSAWKTKSVKVK